MSWDVHRLPRAGRGVAAGGVPRPVSTPESTGKDLPWPVIHNNRAHDELGWSPRGQETTIVQTAEGLRDQSLLEANQ